MDATTNPEAAVTTYRAQVVEERLLGYAPVAALDITDADVERWGLMRQYGRGGTKVVAKLRDGRLVTIARSHQSPAAAKALGLAVAGLRPTHPCNTGGTVTFSWAAPLDASTR